MPNDFTDRLSDVFYVAPQWKARPELAVPAAQAMLDGRGVGSLAGLDQGKQLAEQLPKLPQDVEIQQWNTLTPEMRTLARQSGYKTVLERAQNEDRGGWFRHALSTVGGAAVSALGFPLGAAKDVAGEVWEHGPDSVVGGALAGYQFAREKTNQAVRTNMALEGQGDNFWERSITGSVGAMFSGEWADTWSKVDKGDHYLDPETNKRIQERFDPEIYDLARQSQVGVDFNGRISEMVSAGDFAAADLLNDKLNSPEFAEARSQLDNALLSVGQHFTQKLQLEDNHLAEKLVSGTVDGLYTWYTDPLLVASKAVKGYQIATRGLPGSNDVLNARRLGDDTSVIERRLDKLFTRNDVNQYWDDLGAHLDVVRAKGPEAGLARTEIKRNFKETVPMFDLMLSAGVKDAATARQFLSDGGGYLALVQGQSAFRRPLMPARGKIRMFLQNRKTDSAIDFLEDSHKIMVDDIVDHAGVQRAKFAEAFAPGTGKAIADSTATAREAKVAEQIAASRHGWRGRTATALRRSSTRLPTLTHGGDLDVMGKTATEEVEALARMFGPKTWSRQVSATFAMADEVGRKDIVRGLISTMAEGAGLTKTAEGLAYVNKLKHGMDEATVGTFGVTGVSRLDDGTEGAFLIADARPHLPVPNFAEFYAQAAKIGVNDRIFGRANSAQVDWYTSKVWRPSVLLRPALAFRNAFEEVVNHFARNPSGLIAGRAGGGVVHRAQLASHSQASDRLLEADGAAQAHVALMQTRYGTDSAKALEDRVAALRDEIVATRALTAAQVQGGRAAKTAKVKANEAEIAALRSDVDELVRVQEARAGAEATLAATPKAFDSDLGRMYRIITALPAKLPGGKAKQGAVDDFWRKWAYGRLSDAGMKALKPTDHRYLDELADNEYARTMYNDHINALATRSAKNEIDGHNTVSVKRSGKSVRFERTNMGHGFKARQISGDDGAIVWSARLDKLAADPAARAVMAHIDDPKAAIEAAKEAMRGNAEYLRLRTYKQQGPDVFAANLFNEVKYHLSDRNGELLADIAHGLARVADDGRIFVDDTKFSVEALSKVDDLIRPEAVIGSDTALLQITDNPLPEFIQNGFKMVGDLTAFLSRQPQFYDNYVQARHTLEPLEDLLLKKMPKGENALATEAQRKLIRDKIVGDAIDMAITGTVKYVDNPAIRSQGAVLMRNFAPFYRAQEEFFRRWATTMKYSPEGFARASMLFEGSQDAGIVLTDDAGNKYFHYPFNGSAHKAIVKTSQILGVDMITLPINNPITGKVQMLSPGFNPDSAQYLFNGPIVSMPLQVSRMISGNEGLEDIEGQLLGPQAAGKNWFVSQVPALFRPAADAWMNKEENVASAQKSAFMYLQANDMGLPENATAEQKAQFLERIRKHSLGIMLTRAVLAPILPAYPGIGKAEVPASAAAREAGVHMIEQEFYDLVNSAGYENAYAYWMQRYPDKLPFVAALSESTSGAYIPQTKAAGEFIEGNSQFLSENNLAGPFFIPRGDGPFDYKAYQAAMDLNLKESKNIGDFVDDMLVSGKMKEYYETRDSYEAAVEKYKADGLSLTAESMRQGYDGWRTQFLKLNPLVEEHLAGGGLRNLQRTETVDQMREMLNAGKAPAGETANLFGRLISGYDGFNLAMAPLQSLRGDQITAQKALIRKNAIDWLNNEVVGSEAGDQFLNKVLRPLIGE